MDVRHIHPAVRPPAPVLRIAHGVLLGSAAWCSPSRWAAAQPRGQSGPQR